MNASTPLIFVFGLIFFILLILFIQNANFLFPTEKGMLYIVSSGFFGAIIIHTLKSD